jgi:hypothetical protein
LISEGDVRLTPQPEIVASAIPGLHCSDGVAARVGEVNGRPLTFDHTEFRDARGAPVHAFKAVWISGSDRLLAEGLRTGSQALRTLRMRAAAERFRPAHTRVVQGAANPEAAWELFEANVSGWFGFAPQGGG